MSGSAEPLKNIVYCPLWFEKELSDSLENDPDDITVISAAYLSLCLQTTNLYKKACNINFEKRC